jgi:hypothetical protein
METTRNFLASLDVTYYSRDEILKYGYLKRITTTLILPRKDAILLEDLDSYSIA